MIFKNLLGQMHGMIVRRSLKFVSWLLRWKHRCRRYGFQLCLDLNNVVDRSLLFGEWEPHVCDLLRLHLRNGDLVVEVGANVGVQSLLISSLIGKDGCLIAFEPSGYDSALIASRIKANKIKNIRLIKKALGSEDCGKVVECYYYLGVSERGNPDLIGPEELVSLTDEIDKIEPVKRVSLIKIDVDGMDLSVLRSGKDRISRDRPIIIVEFTPSLLNYYGEEASQFFSFFYELCYGVFDAESHEEITLEEAETKTVDGRHLDLYCLPKKLVQEGL